MVEENSTPLKRWVFQQSTGILTDPDGVFSCVGYAGCGEGRNNPQMQAVPNIGPLPRGFYTFGTPYNSEKVGPYAIPLIPFPENRMYGRGGFRAHGERKKPPFGMASEGCIIAPRAVREEMVASPCHILEVIA